MFVCFDAMVAAECGVNAAVIFQNIAFWVRHNEKTGTNLHEGRCWTYNSHRAYSELYPFMTERAVRTAFAKLISCGFIEGKQLSRQRFDRTMWYTLTEKGKAAVQSENDRDEKSYGAQLPEATEKKSYIRSRKEQQDNPMSGKITQAEIEEWERYAMQRQVI